MRSVYADAAPTNGRTNPMTSPDKTLVALIDDMLFESKIRGAAGAGGWDVHCTSDAVRLAADARAHDAKLVLIDLNIVGADPIEAIAGIRALDSPPRIIAFVSHVDRELAERGRSAGADEVLPRSRFSADLPQLLA